MISSKYGCLSISIEYTAEPARGKDLGFESLYIKKWVKRLKTQRPDILRGCLEKNDHIPMGCETMSDEVRRILLSITI